MKLLTSAANGDGASKPFVSSRHRRKAHLYTLYVWGNFDSADVKLQVSPDPVSVSDASSTWFDVPDADAITAQTVVNVEVRAIKARGTVATGLGAESINMELW